MTPRGPLADSIWELTIGITVLGAIGFMVFAAVMAYSIRRNTNPPEHDEVGIPAPNPDPEHIDGLPPGPSRRMILGGGVLLPLVLVIATLVWTLETMIETNVDPADTNLTISVIGHRWWWEVSYPDGGRQLDDELVLPAGQPVLLELTSADVIHSFWVPALNGKMDALPDRTNLLVVEASEIGELQGRCAEFCGLSHSDMAIDVIVLDPTEFEAWLAGIDGGEDGDR